MATLAAGVFGILLNRVAVPIHGPLLLLLSPVTSLVVGRMFGPGWAVATVLIYGVDLWATSGSAINPFLYAGESVAVAWAARRGRSPILSDGLYWLFLGIPAAWIAMYTVPDAAPASNVLLVIILLKQPANGFLCVTLSNAVFWLPGPARAQRRSGESSHPSIQRFFFEVLVLTITLPLFTLLLFWHRSMQTTFLSEMHTDLRDSSLAVSESLDHFLQKYLDAISAAAEQVEVLQLSTASEIGFLHRLHESYPGFLTMLLADAEGNLYGASPPALSIPQGLNLSDRPYFRIARDTGRPYLSEAFRGRGFGSDPIVAISAPIHSSEGAFRGILEGSLDLYSFDRYEEASRPGRPVLIVDPEGKTVFASESLQLPSLDEVVISVSSVENREVATICCASTETFDFSEARGEFGWTVSVLTPTELTDTQVRHRLKTASLVVLLSVFGVAILAHLTARRLTSPLSILSRGIEAFERDGRGENASSREVLSRRSLAFSEMEMIAQTLAATAERLDEARESEKALLTEKIAADKANEAKTEFLSRVSHELRTPMNAILGLIQIIRAEPLTDPGNAERLESISRAGAHLMYLIDDILDLSRIEAGELTLESQRFDPASLIEDCLSILQESAAAKSIRWNFVLPSPRLWVRADPSRTRQILLNLLGNALKYGRSGGTVEIVLRGAVASTDHVDITITNEGETISPEDVDRLFQPFSRTESARHSEVAGTGLGLAISKGLVQSMGGDLALDSSFTEGCRFRVTLPLGESEAEMTGDGPSLPASDAGPSTTPDDPPPRLLPCRILYVEDDDVSFLIVATYLQKHEGVIVERAGTVQEASKRFSEEPRPQIVLSDLGLPDGSGLDVLDSVRREIDVEIPVLALTANVLQPERDRALQRGFSGFVRKPVVLKDLERLLVMMQKPDATFSPKATAGQTGTMD